MNNRRKFIFQSGMAAAAFLISKPYHSFSGVCSPLLNVNKGTTLVLLHTCNLKNGMDYANTASQIISMKKMHTNTALLHAEKDIPLKFQHLKYDLSWDNGPGFSGESLDYKVIYKNNIKIGIINVGHGENNQVANVNATASRLKKDENCDLVACLSQLGYKNQNGIDDITLAAQSTDIDAIIGGHPENYVTLPRIVRNKNKAEVIINHAIGDATSFGKIEIDFDAEGRKRRVGFGNRRPELIA
jgi:hypothetical protein